MMSQIRLQKVAKQEICARRGKEETGGRWKLDNFNDSAIAINNR